MRSKGLRTTTVCNVHLIAAGFRYCRIVIGLNQLRSVGFRPLFVKQLRGFCVRTLVREIHEAARAKRGSLLTRRQLLAASVEAKYESRTGVAHRPSLHSARTHRSLIAGISLVMRFCLIVWERAIAPRFIFFGLTIVFGEP
jgi:hypothetical protein